MTRWIDGIPVYDQPAGTPLSGWTRVGTRERNKLTLIVFQRAIVGHDGYACAETVAVPEDQHECITKMEGK